MKLILQLLVGIHFFCCVNLSSAEINDTLSPLERYRACMALARTEPEKANVSAAKWIDANGGMPAQHCLAASEFFFGTYEKSATKLEKLERGIEEENSTLRAQILSQAGNAWLMAARFEEALNTQNRAILLSNKDPQLYLDRATSQISLKNYTHALVDLEKAIFLDPKFGDAYLYRAAVKRYIQDLKGAIKDVNKALALIPELPAALLERGIIRKKLGDAVRAREDWLYILKIAPVSAEAKAARDWIQRLDSVK
ncbi:MAG: hypothetical protein CMM58_08865 [Rhodospirillaceae bacterium]|nr:hypothetical protein [Rhodospirillaceae bacterium]